MAALIKAAFKAYKEVVFTKMDRRSDDWLLMNSLLYPFGITGFYLYFVTSLGPRLMKDTPAFKLNGILKVYNIMQILGNLYILERSLTLGWATKFKWFCEPIDYSYTPEAIAIARGVWSYMILKFIDLLDTLFIILRKKHNQISFLHVYHHAGVFFSAWFIVRYNAGGHGTFIGNINSIVHIVMYLYYFVTTTWPEYKENIWWKKYITQLQMAQFLVVSLHSLVAVCMPNCQYNRVLSGMIALQNMVMFILFFDFYRKAYRKKKV